MSSDVLIHSSTPQKLSPLIVFDYDAEFSSKRSPNLVKENKTEEKNSGVKKTRQKNKEVPTTLEAVPSQVHPKRKLDTKGADMNPASELPQAKSPKVIFSVEDEKHDETSGLSPVMKNLQFSKKLGKSLDECTNSNNDAIDNRLINKEIRKIICRELEMSLRAAKCTPKCTDGFHFLPHEVIAKEIEQIIFETFHETTTEYDNLQRRIRCKFLNDKRIRESISRSDLSPQDLVHIASKLDGRLREE